MKIKFNLSFYILIIITLILKLIKTDLIILNQFLFLVLSVTVHEFAHIFVARVYGVKCSVMTFSMFGLNAILPELYKLSLQKKILVLSAGLIANLVLFLSFDNQYFRYINILIIIINILPIYPLDGSKILLYIIEYKVGFINAALILVEVSRIFCIILIIISLFILCLVPFGLYLYIVSIFLYKKNKFIFDLLIYEQAHNYIDDII